MNIAAFACFLNRFCGFNNHQSLLMILKASKAIYFWIATLNIVERFAVLVGSSGLEPPTSRLSGARSNQLSYEPIA